MFKAIALVVFMNGQTMILEDDWGPYETRQECKIRAGEMFNFAMENHAEEAINIKAGCTEVDEEPKGEKI